MADYGPARPEMIETAKQLIEEYHPNLKPAKIAIVTSDSVSVKGGRSILASVSKPSAKVRPLLKAKYDFVIVIADPAWNCLGPDQRKALVDHELSHCRIDLDGKVSLVGHDLEEFADIIDRYGFWRKDSGEEAVQMALFDIAASADGKVESGISKQEEG